MSPFYRQLISDLDRNLARKIGRFELPKIAKKFDTLLSILNSNPSEIRILPKKKIVKLKGEC